MRGPTSPRRVPVRLGSPAGSTASRTTDPAWPGPPSAAYDRYERARRPAASPGQKPPGMPRDFSHRPNSSWRWRRTLNPCRLASVVLQLLNLVALELDDEAAGVADQVIVVGAPLGHLVQRLPGTEVARLGDARLLQQLDGAVDGRQADARVLAARRGEQILQRHVPRRAQEGIDDRLALLRRLEPLALEVGAPVPLGVRVRARARRRRRSCSRCLLSPFDRAPHRGSLSGGEAAAHQRLERLGAARCRVTLLSSFQESSMRPR